MSRLDFLYKMDISHRAVAVYQYLDSRADKKGQCFPAIPTIAREQKLSRSTVKRALKDLEKEKLIIAEQRYRKSGAKSSLLYSLPFHENYAASKEE